MVTLSYWNYWSCCGHITITKDKPPKNENNREDAGLRKRETKHWWHHVN